MVVVMVEPEEMEGPQQQKSFALCMYTSQARTPLLELSLQLSSGVQLSRRPTKILTIVVT